MAKGSAGKGKKGHGGSSGRGPLSTGRAFAKSSADVAAFLASKPELAAPLTAYTGAAYVRINQLLRDGYDAFATKHGVNRAKEVLAMAQATQRAVNRTSEAGHVFRGDLVRGMSASKADVSRWLARGEIVNKSFWSTTVSKSVARNFTGNVVLHFKGGSGVALGRISQFKHEKEVLVPAGRRFKISRSQQNGSVTHIYLKPVH